MGILVTTTDYSNLSDIFHRSNASLQEDRGRSELVKGKNRLPNTRILSRDKFRALLALRYPGHYFAAAISFHRLGTVYELNLGINSR